MPDVPERPRARPLRRAKGIVVFHDVYFAYPGSGRTIMRDASFKIRAGNARWNSGSCHRRLEFHLKPAV